MGDSKGVKDYPEQDKPAAMFVTYYRKNLTPYAGDGRGLRGVVPNYFMGYSLVEIPSDHPEDGSPQGLKDVPIMLMPPAGNDPGKANKGPTMNIITRIWSGATFLKYMKDGDPLAASSASNAMNWMSAKSILSDPKGMY